MLRTSLLTCSRRVTSHSFQSHRHSILYQSGSFLSTTSSQELQPKRPRFVQRNDSQQQDTKKRHRNRDRSRHRHRQQSINSNTDPSNKSFDRRSRSNQPFRPKKEPGDGSGTSPLGVTDKGVEELRAAFLASLNNDRERRLQERSKNASASQSDRQENGKKRGASGFQKNTLDSEPYKPEKMDRLSRLDELLSRSFKRTPSKSGNEQGRQHNIQSPTNSNLWRQSGGAKAFRDRKKLAEQKLNKMKRRKDTNRSIEMKRIPNESQKLHEELMKQNSIAVQQREDEDSLIDNGNDKDVVLPYCKEMSIVDISTLLRIPVQLIAKTLKDTFGEMVPSDNGDEIAMYTVDLDIVELLALELNFSPTRSKRIVSSKFRRMEESENRVLRRSVDDNDIDMNATNDEALYYDSLPLRPPVVSVMGHVDHGKTTLMDSLREKAAIASGSANTNKKKKKKKAKGGKKKKVNDDSIIDKMAGAEAGGITQAISAFQIQLPGSDVLTDESQPISSVTFLDTPGHAAFKSMRESGSNGADVVVLVIAADDGVSPQTVEIIDMYKSIARAQPGSISLVVAMTKIDKPGIDVEESTFRIENELMTHDIFTERMTTSDCEFGDVQMYPVSGLTGDGVDGLVEGLVLVSEIMDLRAETDSRAECIVIDSKIEKGLGIVADCIVRWGSLQKGDFIVSGVNGGRVRILNDANNKQLKKAGPSQPVRITGLRSLPKAGDALVAVKSEDIMNDIIERRGAMQSSQNDESYRLERTGAMDIQITGVASKQDFMKQNVLNKYNLGEGEETKETIRIPFILKADADGTLAALRDSVLKISDESKLDICIDPISLNIGHVNVSDVQLAIESGASILCFNLKGTKDKDAMTLATSEDVDIRSHNVIYHLLDEAKEVISNYIPPTQQETIHGKATVQAVFDMTGKNAGRIAGLMVNDGVLYLDKSSKESGALDCEYRVVRNGEVISPDGLGAESLRKVKEEVTNVRRGEECGLGLKEYTDLVEGDLIECYSVENKKMFV